MRSTFRTLFYLKKNAPKPDGSVPVMCRISIDGAIVQFSCKLSILPDMWDTKANRAIGKSKEANSINTKLDIVRGSINNCYQDLMLKEGFTTAEKVQNSHLGLDVKQHTLMALFNKHNQEFAQKVGVTRAQNSYEVYITVYNHRSKFLSKRYKRNDITLKELNAEFVFDLEQYLRSVNCTTNSINNYMTKLKHVLSKACLTGILYVNPINNYKMEYVQKDRGYLSSEELQKVMDVKFKKRSHELIRDMFVFAAFTGFAYVDVKNLTTDTISKSFDGHLWIKTKQQKTNTPTDIRLLEIPKRILKKYKGLGKGNKVFQIPTNQTCNNVLRKLGTDCGIKTKLTFHVARHIKTAYQISIR